MPCLVNTGHYQSRNYYSENMTPRRLVEHFELELVETGTGFSFIDGKSYPHVQNRLILAKPGQWRFTVGAFSCWFVRFCCPDASEDALLRALPDAALSDSGVLQSMMVHLGALASAPAAPYFARQAALCALLSEACARFQPREEPAAGDPYLPAIIAAKEFLDAHAGEKISLEALAARAHLSRNFFRTKFCQLMGLSPRAYLEQVRLAQARRLLRTTARPLSDVAAACGYDSQSYFTYVFRQQTGQTPLDYRRSPPLRDP